MLSGCFDDIEQGPLPASPLSSEVSATPTAGTGVRFAHVANQTSETVSVIDTFSNTVTATIPVGSAPVGVAITPNGNFAYVTNFNSNTVSVIATSTNAVTATVTVGDGPRGIAITP